MNEAAGETKLSTVVLSVIAVIVGSYVGYATAFANDRKQVRSCISSMLEASRGQVGYGELLDKLRDLDAAETVTVIDENRRDFGSSALVTLSYQIDGRTSRIMCGR